MSKWFRVFGRVAEEPRPDNLLQHLRRLGHAVEGRFRGDEQGWFHADLEPAPGVVLELERYLATENEVRAELNTWAAWLEQAAPDQPMLMEHVVLSTQVFTLQCPDETLDELCSLICRFLARQLDGLCQEDGKGFLTADGVLLVAEA